jgi:hypothetical protein
MSTDAKKLERIQQMFEAPCFHRFLPGAHYCYSLALQELKFHTIRMRRHRLDALFLNHVYFGFKNSVFPFWKLLVSVFLLGISETALFNVCFSSKNCPSARCALAANVVYKDVDVFGAGSFRIIHLL